MMYKEILLSIMLMVIFLVPCKGQNSATYDIVFTSIWNETDHTSVPVNAHWSKLVGATHKTVNAFLQIGSLSTTGIKNIAELGSNTAFETEVAAQITNAEADKYINGPGLGTATGTMTISNLVVMKEFPLLTLVSMIAPSPDWMIAINGYNLLDAGGNWKISATMDLFVYDAGTDSGVDYTSGNSITNPFQPISMISGLPFNGMKIGTLTLTLKSISGISDDVVFNKINIFPNPVSDGKIIISNPEEVTLTNVEIINLSGYQMKFFDISRQGNILSLDVQNLSAGMYILKLTTDKSETLARKLVLK